MFVYIILVLFLRKLLNFPTKFPATYSRWKLLVATKKKLAPLPPCFPAKANFNWLMEILETFGMKCLGIYSIAIIVLLNALKCRLHHCCALKCYFNHHYYHKNVKDVSDLEDHFSQLARNL